MVGIASRLRVVLACELVDHDAVLAADTVDIVVVASLDNVRRSEDCLMNVYLSTAINTRKLRKKLQSKVQGTFYFPPSVIREHHLIVFGHPYKVFFWLSLITPEEVRAQEVENAEG